MITARGPTAACNKKPRLPACFIYPFCKNMTMSVSVDMCACHASFFHHKHAKNVQATTSFKFAFRLFSVLYVYICYLRFFPRPIDHLV